MAVTLYHHPFSRASKVVWMLEEVGVDYELRWVDIMAGAQKAPEFLKLNPMGKLPVLVDGAAVVTESAAIAVYLGDRYASGRLAPALDDPARGTFLRWAFFSPSVLEPAAAAKASGGEFNAGAVGWGSYDAMLNAAEVAVGNGPFLLGERFTMADIILGGTLSFMLQFKMIDARPAFPAYVKRLEERPAYQRSVAKNAAVMAEHGLKH
ncbi:MAG TPA: glutathione S-transferase family protein [Steroidobacteraceae bacterium]|nr:glutathione S-transferase family protein [Steroidobacteraceae bacterium]